MDVNELTGNNLLHDMAEKRMNFTYLSLEPHILNGRNQLLETPLIVAAQQKYLVTLETLLQLSPDVDCQDWNENTTLHHAVHRSDKDFVKLHLLNKSRTNIFNNYGRTCLHMAAATDNYPIMKKNHDKSSRKRF